MPSAPCSSGRPTEPAPLALGSQNADSGKEADVEICTVERDDGDGDWVVVKTFTGPRALAEAREWISKRVTGSTYRIV